MQGTRLQHERKLKINGRQKRRCSFFFISAIGVNRTELPVVRSDHGEVRHCVAIRRLIKQAASIEQATRKRQIE